MDVQWQHCKPEVWGGIECTINRIDDTFRDQLEYAGHYDRSDDLGRISELGITHLRYPVLWERHEGVEFAPIDWTWARRQLTTLQHLGVKPIVGLLHHGSGPAFTDLLDADFPGKFARYARQVAEQFPFVTHYVPVNEPLTTARFSGLYGHWYPHHANDGSFVRALLTQLKATVLAMREIRMVNPQALFIQTEDLSKVHSTPFMKYQADFENRRRWLTCDLLCGYVTKEHPLWSYLRASGASEEDLYFFALNPCPPDIVGLNYYVTSERYLDENVSAYPECLPGGNGRHTYVDTEAVRCGQAAGVACLIEEAWERYHLPVAMTEVHLACTSDEQIRWFLEIWNESCALARQGVDIRAVTAWSLLGAYDWSSLLTRHQMEYETGAFDVSGREPLLTDLGHAIAEVASTGSLFTDMLEPKGWWHHPVIQNQVA